MPGRALNSREGGWMQPSQPGSPPLPAPTGVGQRRWRAGVPCACALGPPPHPQTWCPAPRTDSCSPPPKHPPTLPLFSQPCAAAHIDVLPERVAGVQGVERGAKERKARD